MGAYKLHNYRADTKHLSRLCSLLSNPSRILILQHLAKYKYATCTELQQVVDLSKSSTFEHLNKLRAMEIIKMQYKVHYYEITLGEPEFRKVQSLLEEIDFD